MTTDNTELPPLPKPDTQYITHSDFALLNYGRKCYEAGLAAARAEPAQPAKPEWHSVTIKLQNDGCAWRTTETGRWVALCWTDDGRVWIDSDWSSPLECSRD